MKTKQYEDSRREQLFTVEEDHSLIFPTWKGKPTNQWKGDQIHRVLHDPYITDQENAPENQSRF